MGWCSVLVAAGFNGFASAPGLMFDNLLLQEWHLVNQRTIAGNRLLRSSLLGGGGMIYDFLFSKALRFEN
jgi:hypothetical protein